MRICYCNRVLYSCLEWLLAVKGELLMGREALSVRSLRRGVLINSKSAAVLSGDRRTPTYSMCFYRLHCNARER